MEPEDAALRAAESPFEWELVPGTRFMTFYVADPFIVMYAEAPGPYATRELWTSWCGAQMAALDLHCSLCEAVALVEAVSVDAGAVTAVTCSRTVPHAPGCMFSAETIARLDDGCRPAGYQAGPVTEEETERLSDALATLYNFHALAMT
jgi:hypothetical protein